MHAFKKNGYSKTQNYSAIAECVIILTNTLPSVHIHVIISDQLHKMTYTRIFLDDNTLLHTALHTQIQKAFFSFYFPNSKQSYSFTTF